MLAPWKKSYDQPRLQIKSRDITLPTKVRLLKAMIFPVVMYGCERWTINKTERQRIDAFELQCWRRLLKVPWTARSNQSILKEINPEWIFRVGIPKSVLGRTDAETEAPILQPPDVKRRFTGKDPDAGKDWRPEEKRVREDEMVGWHHWLSGLEFKQTLGVSEGQGSLACWSPCIAKNWTWLSSWTTTQLWKLEVWCQGVGRSMSPLKDLGENLSLPFLAFVVFWQAMGSLAHKCITPVSTSVVT